MDTTTSPTTQIAAPQYGKVTSSPAEMAMNRATLVNDSGGKLQDNGTNVVSKYSPTVMTDSNIRETVIPNTLSAAQPYTNPVQNPTNIQDNQKGSSQNQQIEPQQTKDTDYESLYKSVFGGMQDDAQSPETKQEMDLLSNMKSTADQGFATQISTIEQQYNQRFQLQTAANAAQNGQETNLLLKTGAFNTSTAPTALHAIQTAQINQLGTLQAQENAEVAKIQTAKNEYDYKSMGESMKILEGIRKDKKDLAGKITGDLIKQNEETNKQIIQSNKDNAIANAITSGVIDPSEILKKVDPKLNITTKDVSSAFDTIAKAHGMNTKDLTGNIKNFYSLKNSGSLPSNISKLPEDQQLKAFLDMEKKATTTAADKTKPLYTTNTGAPVTKSDISGGVTKLDESRGDDGFADPKVYKAMYDHWENEGLSPAEFVKQYPPKYYINPSDTSLPLYLRPGTKTTTTPVNPFAKDSSPSGSP